MERLGQDELHKVIDSCGGSDHWGPASWSDGKVGASYVGTRARSAYELGEGMTEPDMMRGRSPNGDCGPQRVEQTAGLMEACLLAPQCSQRHRPSACNKFKDLSLQHRQSVIVAKELCVRCLRHSDLDEIKKKECIRRKTQPYWLGSDVREPGASPCQERDLPRWRRRRAG
jgi:hypothetical protein